MSRQLAIMVGLLLVAPSFGHAQGRTTGFIDRTTTVDGQLYRYQIYVPREYDPSREWPVILFLHGAGERGSDGLLQTEIGLPSAIRRAPDRYPAIVIAPQAPIDATWQGQPGQAAMQALDRTMAEFNTDPDRVYLTGMSMGGNGSWYLAYRYPDRFAAVAVVCGFVTPFREWPDFVDAGDGTRFEQVAERLRSLPVWIAHGDADPVVPVMESQRMHAALEAAGATVLYHELPGVGHNAWDATYRDPEFAAWLLARKRN